MVTYLVRRLVWLVPTWLLVSIVAFLIMYLAPGNPAILMLGVDAPQEAVIALEKQHG